MRKLIAILPLLGCAMHAVAQVPRNPVNYDEALAISMTAVIPTRRM